MKTIFKSTILLAAVGLSLFTSCKDDNESNPTLTQPTQFVLNEIAEQGNIDLEKSESVTLTWSQPTPYNNFNAPVIPTYTIEVSPTGQFTQAYDPNAEDNTGADYFVFDETFSSGRNTQVSANILNRSLQQLCGWTETTVPATQQVFFRVESVIRDASFYEYNSIYSNVVSATTIPYYVELRPADPEIWWLIGSDIADGSWGGDIGKCVIPMQTIEGAEYDKKTGQGEIQWIGYLSGNGFKLRGSMDDSWATQIGQNDGGYVKNDGGSGNITVSEPGVYKITLNTAELAKVPDGGNTTALKIEKYENAAPVFGGMAIAGSFNDWGNTEMTPCSTDWENHDWYIAHDFAASDEVKVKESASWDYNKGGSFIPYSAGMYVYGVNGGDNLVIPEAGNYLIIFNDITGYIRFIKQ